MNPYIRRIASLAQGLLGGTALSVLAAVPILAQVPVAPQLKLYSGSYHSKTNIRDSKNPATTTYTSTVDISGTISESVYYWNWEELWPPPAHGCKDIKVEFPKRSSAARIKAIATRGEYELFYKLESKSAGSDSFSGEFKGRHCGGSARLNLLM